MKRIILILVLCIGCCFSLVAQQITRIAVIDIQKVYMTYFKDSLSVRNFEDEKYKVQQEINRLSEEIKELQKRRLEVQARNDAAALKRLDDDLLKKAQYLSDYIKVKQTELDDKAKALSNDDAFMQNLRRRIQQVGESEGFSLVISIKDLKNVTSPVLWYNYTIDITDKVIQAMVSN